MKTTENVKKIGEIKFIFWDLENYYRDTQDAIKYWFDEDNFTRLITHLYGEREFYIGEIFDFYKFNTQEIKDENDRNLFDRDLYVDFDDILSINRKYFQTEKSDKSNKVTTTIVYELIALNH